MFLVLVSGRLSPTSLLCRPYFSEKTMSSIAVDGTTNTIVWRLVQQEKASSRADTGTNFLHNTMEALGQRFCLLKEAPA